MLLEIAIGDALGAPYEFAPAERRAAFALDGYATPDGVGRYTDDTQMSMAVAEHLLAGRPNTQESWAESFLEARHRDPQRAGYSKRVSAALNSPSPRRMLERCNQPGVRGNGSVMRCVPLGLLADPAEVASMCLVQSSATHASLACAQASCAVALAAHYCYHSPKPGARFRPGLALMLVEHLGRYAATDVLAAWVGGEVPCDAMQTASYCLRHLGDQTMEDAVTDAVATGGDVDSTCAVLCGLYSLLPPVAGGEPGPLVERLEDGPYGRRRLERLDAALLKKFPRHGRTP